jgi:CheY-like chemotaxis protein
MRSRRTVLLIMNDLQRRCTLREHLVSQGFSVFATGSTPAALNWLERHAASIVVADCLLPGTRVAIPHFLKRRALPVVPRTVGIVHAPLTMSERLRELLGYDELVPGGTPVALLTKRLLQQQN